VVRRHFLPKSLNNSFQLVIQFRIQQILVTIPGQFFKSETHIGNEGPLPSGYMFIFGMCEICGTKEGESYLLIDNLHHLVTTAAFCSREAIKLIQQVLTMIFELFCKSQNRLF
jgi:hypothetical protein